MSEHPFAALEGLEQPEDLRFQERTWVFERVGWLVLSLLVAAALAGGLGRGRLARTHASDGVLSVDYEWIARNRTDTGVEVSIARPASGAAREGEIRLVLGGDFARQAVDWRGTAPVRNEIGATEAAYVFPVTEWTAPCTISLTLRPERPGRAHGVVAVELSAGTDERPSVAVTQIVLP